jgi:hypothetical protein
MSKTHRAKSNVCWYNYKFKHIVGASLRPNLQMLDKAEDDSKVTNTLAYFGAASVDKESFVNAVATIVFI